MATLKFTRWTRPFGIKVTEWVAVLAFILSVGGLFWSTFASLLHPRIHTESPEEIQLQCIGPVLKKGKEGEPDKAICKDESGIKVFADLFSMWNNSFFSTKPQILIKANMKMKAGDLLKADYPWKHFTEILDHAGSRETNAGRAIIRQGELRNIEISFSPVADSNKYTWAQLVTDILANRLSIEFTLDYAYGSSPKFICTLLFNDKNLTALKNNQFEYHYVTAVSTCKDITT